MSIFNVYDIICRGNLSAISLRDVHDKVIYSQGDIQLPSHLFITRIKISRHFLTTHLLFLPRQQYFKTKNSFHCINYLYDACVWYFYLTLGFHKMRLEHRTTRVDTLAGYMGYTPKLSTGLTNIYSGPVVTPIVKTL